MLVVAAIHAQQAAPPPAGNPPAAQQSDPREAARAGARAAMLHGPQLVSLADQATLALPPGYSFVPKQQGAALMQLLGNRTNASFIGLIFPESDAQWFASLEYEPAGHIEDAEASRWDIDELLDSLKEGTRRANAERRKLGITPLEVTDWVEVPSYDRAQHRLVWSAQARQSGVQNSNPTVNYNTHVLGREGYISLYLVTSGMQVEQDKPAALELLRAIQFNEGKRYADFNAATDKVADYGIAALISGPTVKPLGGSGVLGRMWDNYGKFILIGVAATAGFLARRRTRHGRQAA